MDEELKPCPFCGGKASGKAWSNPSGEFGPGCTDCGVTAESSVTWNTRTLPQPAAVEAVEVMAYALEHPEAGYKVYKQFSQWMVDGEWECRPLMTIAQHQRILAASAGSAEPVAWHTEDHLTDKSATTYDPEIAKRWRAKGWPVTPLYTHPADQVADDPTTVKVPRELLEEIVELHRRRGVVLIIHVEQLAELLNGEQK